VRGGVSTGEYAGVDFIGDAAVGANPIARIAMLRDGGNGSKLQFGTSNSWTGGVTNIALTIDSEARIGIGTTTPQNKLDVAGAIRCTEVKVVALPWADFVFQPSYKLRTLGEVEQFIKANHHLPEIPTAKEVKENGVGLGEMNAKLLQKVEELTLYLIEKDKENKIQDSKIKLLEEEIERIKESQQKNSK
jgi:hypothetical protein